MIEYQFSLTLRSVPYAVFASGEDILFVCGTACNAALPIWLREHLVNAVSAEATCRPRPRRNNVIDFTAARALRREPVLQMTAT